VKHFLPLQPQGKHNRKNNTCQIEDGDIAVNSSIPKNRIIETYHKHNDACFLNEHHTKAHTHIHRAKCIPTCRGMTTG